MSQCCQAQSNQWYRSLSVGSNALDASSIFDINSTLYGSRPCPSMTTGERDAISSPVNGLCIYNITTNQLNYYNGSIWGAIGGGGDLWSDPVDSDIVPDTDSAYDLGSLTFNFANSFVDQMFIENTGSLAVRLNNNSINGVVLRTENDNSPMTVQTVNNTDANADPTESVYILSGKKTAGTGNSGNISIETGTSAGGTRGTIRLVDGSEGISGDVWTSSGTGGEGNWVTPTAHTVVTTENKNLDVIGGGVWDFNGTNLTLSEDAYVQFASFADDRNTILAQSIAITDGQVAYVDVNKTTDSTSNLTVNTAAIASYTAATDRYILARRESLSSLIILSEQTSENTQASLLSPSNTSSWRAQQFTTIAGGGTLKSIKLRMWNLNDGVTGTFDVCIQGDNGGDQPDGTDIDCLTIDPTGLPSTDPSTLTEYFFDDDDLLSGSTKYHQVYKATNLTGSDSIVIRYSSLGHTGTFRISTDSGSTWGSDVTNVDLLHEVSGEISAGSVVTVAGGKLALKNNEEGRITDGISVIKKVTADPCGDLVNFPESRQFYNDTSDYYCFCDGAGVDVQMHSPATACF